MKKQRLFLLLPTALLIFACNLPSVAAPLPNPEEIPVATLPPVLATSTVTAAIGSANPFASPDGQPLNCRTGPGMNWPVVIVLSEGQAVEIAGKNPEATWWYVKNPSLAGGFCWISMSYATTTGDTSGVAVVAVPPTASLPTDEPGSSAGVVTSVDVSVSPDLIHVAGCMGPIQPVTVYAKIHTNGAIKIEWHFKDSQSGDLPSHSLKFTRADIQDVSESFTPLVNDGKHKITLIIDGTSMKGVTYYEVTC